MSNASIPVVAKPRSMRSVFATLGPVFKRQHWKLALTVLTIPFVAYTTSKQPALLRDALAAATTGHASALRTALFAYAMVAAFDILGRFTQSLALQFAGLGLVADLRKATFERLNRMPLAELDRSPIGKWVTRTTSDCDALSDAFASGALLAFVDIAVLIFTLVAMLRLDARIALIALSGMPLLLFAMRKFSGQAQSAFRLIRESIAKVTASTAEQVEGIGVIAAYGQETRCFEQFSRLNDDHRQANYTSIRYDALLYSVVESSAAYSFTALLVAGVIFGTNATGATGASGDAAATVVLTIAMAEYVQRLFMPLRDLAQKFAGLQYAYAASERVADVLDMPIDAEPVHPPLPSDSTNAIECDSITFAHRNRPPLFIDLDLNIGVGEYVGIVGPSGSGKSTITSLLLGLYHPQKGTIRIRDRAPANAFAVVTQDALLMPGSVLDNIAFFEPKPDRSRAQKALEQSGLVAAIAAKGGLDFVLDTMGSGLSSGERQLLMIARALYLERPFLILDEATASVDPATEEAVQRAVLARRGSTTILQIAHRLSTVTNADRILVLERGCIVEQGTHTSLLALGGLYARLFHIEELRRHLGERAAS